MEQLSGDSKDTESNDKGQGQEKVRAGLARGDFTLEDLKAVVENLEGAWK